MNDQYITVVRRSLRGTAGFAEGIGRFLSTAADHAAVDAQRKTDIKALYDATDNVVGTLAKYGARRLGIYETEHGTNSEILEFLNYLLNHEMRPMQTSANVAR